MFIGVDLGGTNIAAGLTDESGVILRRACVKTLSERGPEAVAKDIADICLNLCEQSGTDISAVRWVGIGSPGAVDSAVGRVLNAYNLGFADVPLADMVRAHLPDTKIHLENDANAAALGETAAGGAKGYASSVCVTLGTGIGGGIIIDGKIYTGFNGGAGEIGHHVIVADGVPCKCGRKGCWEQYASATGLIRLTKKTMDSAPESLMWRLSREHGKVGGRTAFDAMRAGDAAGRAVVDEYLNYVAIGITNIIDILQPEAVCIGGGIAGEGQPFLDALSPLVYGGVFKAGDKATALRLATLGNDAGIIGAGFLGLD